MRVAKYGSLILFVLLLCFGLYAVLTENPFTATGTYLSLAWSQATIADVFTGLLIFYAWVYYREKSLLRTLPWLLLAILVGNVTSTLYLFLAFRKSGYDMKKFFFGKRAE